MTASRELPGLGYPVRVVRDRLSIPHVIAGRAVDAYRALGYVMASDRLWQMDLMRRLGSGRVAEVLGGLFVPLDAFVRTVGLPEAVARAERRLEGEAAEMAAAFAAGVSAWIGSVSPGPEFDLLGYVPEPWRPADSLAIEYFVGLALGLENLEPKLTLARALGMLGAERGAWLYPCPLPAADLDPERLAAYAGLDDGLFAVLAALAPPPAGGSNAWAVAPRRAAGGAALVAGDPHLLHAAPSPWYLVHLVAPGLDVAGAAYVGGPVVQVGRNPRGAWSVTNLTADDADLVLERLDADGGERYAVGGGAWEPLATREVTIAVRGDEAVRLRVRATRHGPLVDGVAALGGGAPGAAVALRWKGVEAPGHSLGGWLAVHRSAGLDDVLRAETAFDGAPFASNFVYADVDGHLTHLALGGVPRRRSGAGFLPRLGWREEGEWQDVASLGARPWRVDPAEGAVWTANERTGAADGAAGGDGQPFGEHSARARRIRAVLLASVEHTVSGFARLQVDDLDLSAAANLPFLREALADWTPDDGLTGSARDLLLAWDGRTTADSAGAAIYHVLFFAEWLPALVPEESCPGFARHWRIATWGGEAVLQAPRSPWFADPVAKASALHGCAARAVVRLRALLGDDPTAWRWGELHRVGFAHPLAFAPRFAAGAIPSRPLGGSPFSVNQQRLGSATPPFGAVVGAGVRMVTDLADPDHLHLVLSTGESGDPESAHFADHLPAWATGHLFRVALDPSRIERVSELTLRPPDSVA